MRIRESEADILRACLDYLAVSRRAFAWRTNAGGLKTPDASRKKGYRYVAFNGADGISDIIGVLRCGHMLACEVKSAKGELRANQFAFLKSVREFGGVGIVVRSASDLQLELDEHQRRDE